jgi:hypothetical protein
MNKKIFPISNLSVSKIVPIDGNIEKLVPPPEEYVTQSNVFPASLYQRGARGTFSNKKGRRRI